MFCVAGRVDVKVYYFLFNNICFMLSFPWPVQPGYYLHWAFDIYNIPAPFCNIHLEIFFIKKSVL